jgi:asparagine synthase (glutamine-hydrolysing)
MCGIAGLISPAEGSDPRATLGRMLATIQHRGPDEEGVWSDGRATVGTRRLSIIDLPGGHQPIEAPDGTVIAYNGEVYNYRALRDELEGRGSSFRTNSDTEVVLEAYRAWGIDAIERLQGMFAFCLYDPGRGIVHLVRDRLGKKPLYVLDQGSGIVFASELKAILAGLGTRPPVDMQSIHDFLTYRYVPAPATIWAGIRKVEPGHRLELDLRTGERRTRRWWSAEFESARLDPDRDYGRELETLLLEAVEKRLLASDVPVGVLLSGGIDSSAVSAAAVELGHRDFHTFSVGFADPKAESELPYARALAEHIGSDHHEVLVDRDEFVDFLDELVWATDEPLADLASVPLHFVSRLAREHVKVVLSGEGADEILAGYNLEQTAARIDRWRRLARVPRPMASLAARVAPEGRAEWLPALAAHGWSGILRGSRAHMTWVFDDAEKEQLWRGPQDLLPSARLLDGWYAETVSDHPLDQLQQVLCRSWLVEDLLMKADKMSMLASLELRVPFLDHALVEWAMTAPLETKVGSRAGGWSSKLILREFARRRVPAEIIERPKRGFPVPAYDWLSGPLRDWLDERLLGASAGPLLDLFDRDAVQRVARAAQAGDTPAAHRAWSLVVLGSWLSRWS